MPFTDGVRNGAVAHEHCMYGHAKEPLDRRRRVGGRRHKVRERSDNRALAKRVALFEQSGGGWSKSDTLALQALQAKDTTFDGRVQVLNAPQLRSCSGIALACGKRGKAGFVEGGLRPFDAGAG